ncbi:MAG: signal peptidase II, partial [Solirubrobacteraceae bacterium]
MIEPPPNPSDPQAAPSHAVDGSDVGQRGRQRARAWLRAALVIVAVIVLDQLTKHAVEQAIAPGEEKKFLPGIELVNTRNHGVAFGILPGNQVAVTILVSLALVALVVYFALHSTQHLMWLPTGMLIGG